MKEILNREISFTTDNENFLVLESSSSKGAQPKWYNSKLNVYVKQDINGYESVAECVVYTILNSCSTIPKEDLVEYRLCTVDGKTGCYSPNFKYELEDEINLRRVLRDYTRMEKVLSSAGTAEARFDIMCEAIEKFTGGISFRNELKRLFAIDAFFINEDRHLANISILYSGGSHYRLAPIFDNGLSLLSNLNLYPKDIRVTSFKHDARAKLPSAQFSKNAKLYDLEPFLYKSKIQEFIKENRSIIPRVCALLQSQLKEPHLQHLFIERDNVYTLLKRSNLFG